MLSTLRSVLCCQQCRQSQGTQILMEDMSGQMSEREEQRNYIEQLNQQVLELQEDKHELVKNLKVAAEEQTAEREKLTAEIEKLRTNVEQQHQQVTQLHREKDGLTQELKDAKEEHGAEREKLMAEIKKQKTELEQQHQQVTQLHREKDGLTQEMKGAREEHGAEREKLMAEIEKQKNDLDQQRQRLTELHTDRNQLEQEMKLSEERHAFEMERQKIILESQNSQVLAQMKDLKEAQREKQEKLDQMKETKRTLKLEKEELITKIAALEAEKTTMSEANKAEVEKLRNKISKIQKAMEDNSREEKKVRDEYGQRIANVEEEIKKLPTEENLEELLKKSTNDRNISCPVQDEEIVKKIRTVFVSTAIPQNMLHMFHKYNTDVLVQQDIEVIRSITSNYGKFHGAGELLSCLVRYKGWFSCLVQVLRDPNVKLGHVADAMWDALGMGETREKNASIDEVKEKVKTAVRTLEHIKHMVSQQQNSQLVSQDGVRCLNFILQTWLNYPSYRIEVGDYLCDTSLTEICMKILREQVSLTQLDDDNMWPVIEYTCLICRNYSTNSSTFSKRLAESGTVDCITNILKERCITDNLHRERQRSVVKHSLSVLRNIAMHVGKIPEFRESKTIEVVIPLINSNNKEVKVRAMMVLVHIVEEEERDKLTDTSGVIQDIVEGLHHAVYNSQDRKYDGFTAASLSACLAQMSVCDVNRPKIVEAGVLGVFVDILKHTEPDRLEQGWSAQCLFELAHDEGIKQTIQGVPDLLTALQDLKNSQHDNVRHWVGKALNVILGYS